MCTRTRIILLDSHSTEDSTEREVDRALYSPSIPWGYGDLVSLCPVGRFGTLAILRCSSSWVSRAIINSTILSWKPPSPLPPKSLTSPTLDLPQAIRVLADALNLIRESSWKSLFKDLDSIEFDRFWTYCHDRTSSCSSQFHFSDSLQSTFYFISYRVALFYKTSSGPLSSKTFRRERDKRTWLCISNNRKNWKLLSGTSQYHSQFKILLLSMRVQLLWVPQGLQWLCLRMHLSIRPHSLEWTAIWAAIYGG